MQASLCLKDPLSFLNRWVVINENRKLMPTNTMQPIVQKKEPFSLINGTTFLFQETRQSPVHCVINYTDDDKVFHFKTKSTFTFL